MTLHKMALEWVAESVSGRINHAKPPSKSRYDVMGLYPDVVENVLGLPSTHILHEVEAIGVPKGKIKTYGQAPLRGVRKVLWIVLPQDVWSAFNEIKVIEKKGTSFVEVGGFTRTRRRGSKQWRERQS